MNGQQIHALLGQWYDVVGRDGFRPGPHQGPHRPWQQRSQHGQRWQPPWNQNFWGGGYGYGYGDGLDQSAFLSSLQQQNAQLQQLLQLQLLQAQAQAQAQAPAPVAPVQSTEPPPAAAPPATAGWIGAEAGFPVGLGFPPRAAVVNAPLPTQANRDILPMSTGVPILPTQSAQITGRPQTLVFKIGRFLISNAGTAGGAADWIVNDIKI